MKAPLFWRKVHYWASFAIALPLLLIVITGLLLHLKKDFDWIQPRELRGNAGAPNVPFSEILSICIEIPELAVSDWDDIQRLDIRPSRSLLKVTTENGLEAQIDPTDGRVLQVAVRRSDWIEALHDGSWFGDAAKRWLFLPTGALLALLWATGIYLFLLPQLRRLRPRTPR